MKTVPDLSQPYIPGAWLRKKPIRPLNLVHLWRTLAREHPDPLVQLRLEWVLHLRSSGSVTRSATHFGISRKCLQKWRDRFQSQGIEGLTNHSRRPHQCRRWTLPKEQRTQITELKEEFPAWGREKLCTLYQKRFDESVTEWQIQRVIADKGLQWKRQKRKRKPGSKNGRPRIQNLDQRLVLPFQLIHADSIELRFTGGIRRYIFTNLDHVTRIGFGRVATTKHARHAAALFAMTQARYPQIQYLHSDNGSDHQGALDTILKEGLIHFVSRPRTPTDNARLERFHRTLQDECFPSLTIAPSLGEMQEKLDSWLTVYNTVRPHQALGNQTPNEYLETLAPLQGDTHVVI